MTRILYLPLLILTLLFSLNPAMADDSKELRKQRQAAQKERQAQKNERSKESNEARKAFREYTRELKMEYQEQVKGLDTEFKLRRVELKADHDVKVAEAEAEYQKKLSGLFINTGVAFDEQAIEQLQAEGKDFADELFALRKQSGEELHRERVANEQRKNDLLNAGDRMALDKASALGLTKDYAPILATPIGDGLSKQEERWNERENKAVGKQKDRNRMLLVRFRNGEKLRNWEVQKLHEDFKLTWDEKSELHALDSQQLFYNAMLMQSVQGGQLDQQAFMAKMADANKQKKLINIKYRKIKDQNRIKRKKERNDILSN